MGLAGGFALALLGLVPAWWLTSGVDPDDRDEGQLIYVFWPVAAPPVVPHFWTRAVDDVRTAPVRVGWTLVDRAEVAALGGPAPFCDRRRGDRRRRDWWSIC